MAVTRDSIDDEVVEPDELAVIDGGPAGNEDACRAPAASSCCRYRSMRSHSVRARSAEIQEVRVVDDAARIRVFIIDTRWIIEGIALDTWRGEAHSFDYPAARAAPAAPAGRTGYQRRPCAVAVSIRPRGVRATKPSCSRNGSMVSSIESRCFGKRGGDGLDTDQAAVYNLPR